MNLQIMLLHLALLAWCRATTFPHVGRITLLIPHPILLAAGDFGDFRKNWVTFVRSILHLQAPKQQIARRSSPGFIGS